MPAKFNVSTISLDLIDASNGVSILRDGEILT